MLLFLHDLPARLFMGLMEVESQSFSYSFTLLSFLSRKIISGLGKAWCAFRKTLKVRSSFQLLSDLIPIIRFLRLKRTEMGQQERGKRAAFNFPLSDIIPFLWDWRQRSVFCNSFMLT